jgi:hypothetical protein
LKDLLTSLVCNFVLDWFTILVPCSELRRNSRVCKSLRFLFLPFVRSVAVGFGSNAAALLLFPCSSFFLLFAVPSSLFFHGDSNSPSSKTVSVLCTTVIAEFEPCVFVSETMCYRMRGYRIRSKLLLLFTVVRFDGFV